MVGNIGNKDGVLQISPKIAPKRHSGDGINGSVTDLSPKQNQVIGIMRVRSSPLSQLFAIRHSRIANILYVPNKTIYMSQIDFMRHIRQLSDNKIWRDNV